MKKKGIMRTEEQEKLTIVSNIMGRMNDVANCVNTKRHIVKCDVENDAGHL